jgi:LuxR family maltose regulon positive regulatory protein
MRPTDTAADPPVAGSLVRRDQLHDRLSGVVPGGVAVVCAPAGSGKTVLLRSWLKGPGRPSAWVSVERGEEDPQRFWLAVVDALVTAAGAGSWVERVSPSPGFRGDAVVEQLLTDLAALDAPVVLVIDDLHELRSQEALDLLESFLTRLPPTVRAVLATREEPRLGLHRVRLAGALTEVRAGDLRFSEDETRELLESVGIRLSDEGLALLCERTEGWAAGVRLAALSLTGHADPERFVREFSGSERTVAGYLLAEVLERQPPDARALLLRTSPLDRVSGSLADFVTGGSGAEAILQRLADANAFVTPLDAGRTWFRYHHLFADLLRLELRRSDPQAIGALHRAAAQWYEAHGDVIEAVRHAQAAADWPAAARLVAGHYLELILDGRMATVRALLSAFPAEAFEAHAELPVLHAGVQVFDGLLDEAALYLAAGRRLVTNLPDDRRPAFDLLEATVRLWLASRRNDVASAGAAARDVDAAFAAQSAGGLAQREEYRIAALYNLGVAELWALRLEDAQRHLEQALALARRIGRPYLETVTLAFQSLAAMLRDLPLPVARTLADDAVAIADEHGWSRDPIAAPAFVVAGATLVWAGRWDEAVHHLERARLALPAAGDPSTELIAEHATGLLHLGHGRPEEALGSFHAAERLGGRLPVEHPFTPDLRSRILRTRVQRGETAAVRSALAGLDEQTRDRAGMRIAAAAVELADGTPGAAVEALGPVVDRSARALLPHWTRVEGLLFEAAARDRMGDRRAAEDLLEEALEIAEPEGMILPFTLAPVRRLLERHPSHRTAHATLLADVLDVTATGKRSRAPRTAGAPSEHDLSDAELRVVRYLPTNLTVPAIAGELILSPNTVGTHLRHIYAKLGVHSRSEAVARARELGLLAPSLRAG